MLRRFVGQVCNRQRVCNPLGRLRTKPGSAGNKPARRMQSCPTSERGFVLIAMSVSMLLLLAVIGLAFDLGRIYIVRNEAQVFTDAAAMAAAARLDGTAGGIRRAREAVARLPGRWNLGTSE